MRIIFQLNKVLLPVILIFTFALAACATNAVPATSTVKSMATSVSLASDQLKTTLTPTATATPTPISIKAAHGTLSVKKVGFLSKDTLGNVPKPGYTILWVWFTSLDGGYPEGSNLFEDSRDVYVVGDDGSETKSYLGGLVQGELVVGFTPPASAKMFTLIWPGNPPVELPEPIEQETK